MDLELPMMYYSGNKKLNLIVQQNKGQTMNKSVWLVLRVSFIILAVLTTVNCSHHKMLLSQPGTFFITNDEEQIKISDKHEVLIEWNNGSRDLVTSALIEEQIKSNVYGKVESLITVNIIEANDSLIRLGSRAWKYRDGIPSQYLEADSDIELVNINSTTILIPWRQIKNIYIYDRKYTWDDFFESPKMMLIGGAVGTAIFGGLSVEAAKSELDVLHGTTVSQEEIISAGLTGAVIGSIVYPIFTYFRISYAKETGEEIKNYSRKFRVNSPGSGCQIKIVQTE